MTKLTVYDPPMCCSTGVCGPEVDPALPRVAADLDWLRRQGVEVERYNLAQQPLAFAANAVVKAALHEDGNGCLPLILVDGAIVSRGTYPDRSGLSRLVGLEAVAGPEPVKAEKSSCCSAPATVAIGGARGPSSCECC